MNSNNDAKNLARENLARAFRAALPRMLTQACRDPGNPAFGCFDRNWWHYRMRDFSSIILQQGAYAAACSTEFCGDLISADFAKELAAGSCRFWNKRAKRRGAFEEYYPRESGYPPLAFSTLAVAKLVDAGVIPASEIKEGLAIAAWQLSKRFERRAANQQVAGLAALAWLRKIVPGIADDNAFAKQKRRTLALQTAEGWFWEYDGPDIGYLAVTIDCLWDLHDATGDADFLDSARKAQAFIHSTVALPRTGLGMLNARNTDYLVPYGIARFAAAADGESGAEIRAKARETLEPKNGG